MAADSNKEGRIEQPPGQTQGRLRLTARVAAAPDFSEHAASLLRGVT